MDLVRLSRKNVLIPAVCLALSAALAGCGDDNNDNRPNQPGTQPPVEGVNLSGNYRFSQIECFDTEGETIAIGTINDYTQTVNISGNSVTFNDSSGDCSATVTGRIVFNADNTARFSQGKTTVPSGSCSVNTTMDLTLAEEDGDDDDAGESVPVSFGFQDDEPTPDSTVGYVRNEEDGSIGIDPLRGIDIPDLGEARCLAVYERS